MKNFIFQFIIIILISVSIGLIYNSFLKQPLPVFGKYDSSFLEGVIKGNTTKTDLMPFRIMNREKLFALLEDDQVIIVDARQSLEFQLGHIPGAINLPIQEFELEYPNLLNSIDKNKTIITYCSEMYCSDSELLAQKLFELGHSNIFVYKGGFKEWQEHGYPIKTLPTDGEVNE